MHWSSPGSGAGVSEHVLSFAFFFFFFFFLVPSRRCDMIVASRKNIDLLVSAETNKTTMSGRSFELIELFGNFGDFSRSGHGGSCVMRMNFWGVRKTLACSVFD